MTQQKAHKPESVGLPPRPFLYSLDQIAVLLSVTPTVLGRSYIHYEGRTTGMRHPDRMLARNIAPADQKPEWRVAENELLRWMKRKGYRFHERGWLVI